MSGVRGWRAALALVALLLLGQQVVGDGPLTRLDRTVEDWLVPRRDGTAGHLARLLTDLGTPSLVVPLLVVLVLVLAVRERSVLLPLRVGGLLLALALCVLGLKDAVARPAAHGGFAHGGAWPSGHTATATVVWGCAVLLLRPPRPLARLLDVGVPALVAAALVVAGYHQVTDVLAGSALGTLLLQLLPARVARPGVPRASPPRDASARDAPGRDTCTGDAPARADTSAGGSVSTGP